jgi:hypothetical protein
MLRIERSANGQVGLTLSGRMQAEDIERFQQLLIVGTPGQPMMFDLRHVTLANQDDAQLVHLFRRDSHVHNKVEPLLRKPCSLPARPVRPARHNQIRYSD